MVDTVLLHTAKGETRAARIADALSDRNAVTYALQAGQRRVGFGPQVVVVGVVSDAGEAQQETEHLVDTVSVSPGLRLILTPPNGASPAIATRAKNCVVISGAADSEADAGLIRAAIADAEAAAAGRGKKKKSAAVARQRGPKLSAPLKGAAASATLASRAVGDSASPAAKLAPQEAPPKPLPYVPRTAVETAPSPTPPRASNAFDPGKARRVSKMGYAIGVAIGIIVAGGVALAFIRAHESPEVHARAHNAGNEALRGVEQ
ncbi:MAG: hypothetical protein ABUL42_01890 [Terricaulis silvestris]